MGEKFDKMVFWGEKYVISVTKYRIFEMEYHWKKQFTRLDGL